MCSSISHRFLEALCQSNCMKFALLKQIIFATEEFSLGKPTNLPIELSIHMVKAFPRLLRDSRVTHNTLVHESVIGVTAFHSKGHCSLITIKSIIMQSSCQS